MRILGALALVLSLAACAEEPDPYAGYSEAEERWLLLQEYEPGSEEADASIRWAESVCGVFAAGGKTSDIFNELDSNGWNNKREDYALMADIGDAERIFCPED